MRTGVSAAKPSRASIYPSASAANGEYSGPLCTAQFKKLCLDWPYHPAVKIFCQLLKAAVTMHAKNPREALDKVKHPWLFLGA